MLDPSTFTYAGVPYTVKRLYVTGTGFVDFVSFETSPALPNDAGLVLRVPTFKTDDVPMVVEYQDFEIYSPDTSNPGLFSWGVSLTSCLSSENWAADLTTTGTVKLIEPAGTPAVTLALSAGSIGEDGGVSTVTATVSPASAAAFTVTAAAVSPAVAADFRLSANQVLRFAENATTSAGTVTITGVDNDVDAADKTVTVSGTVSATGVTAPPNRTLTLEDDDAAGVRVSAVGVWPSFRTRRTTVLDAAASTWHACVTRDARYTTGSLRGGLLLLPPDAQCVAAERNNTLIRTYSP